MHGDKPGFSAVSMWRRYVYILPALVVAALVAGAEIATENFINHRYRDEQRVSVTTQLSTVRARLEGTVFANAQLVRGLVAAIAIEPDLSQGRFTGLASQLFQSRSQLRNIGAAPGMVIRFMYPMEGNEAAIGLDYRQNREQRAAAERARDAGEIIIAGPVDLVQGGQGFISRMPVFIPREPGENKEFWGLVSAVIDVEGLYRDGGLLDKDLPVEIAIRGKDAHGPSGEVFFGDAALFDFDPVLANVTLPYGAWQMAAIPRGGWADNAENVWLIRILFLMAGVLMVAASMAGMHLVRQRKLSDLAVQESETRLRAIMDNAPAAIFLKDCNGVILAANKTFLARRDIELDQIVGKTTHEVNDKAVADEVIRQERIVMESGEPQTFEVIRNLPGIGDRSLMVVRFPVIAPDGRNVGVGGISIDVTDRAVIERQLVQAQKMEVVGQLTGGVAHDFNNLLQVIESSLELAQLELSRSQAVDCAKVADILENALLAGQRGASLTQKLLAYSRKQTLRPQKIDAQSLIDGLKALLTRTLGEDIRIETEIENGQSVLVDETGLTNALLNLAVNSRAAMPQGGTLTISVANRRFDRGMKLENEVLPAGDYVEFAVTDTGVGMPADVSKRAFEPFFTTKEVGEGSGLGLSMVYGFARQSGGNVSIESEPGKGTTVRILLPHAGSELLPPVDEPEVKEEPPFGHAKRVLLVEDDKDVRASTVFLLEALGCEVLEAADASPVPGMLEKDPTIDLLLSDVVLPGGKNGVELAREAKQIRPDLKVILVSGYPEGILENAGLGTTTFRVLGKPFSIDALSQALSLVMRS